MGIRRQRYRQPEVSVGKPGWPRRSGQLRRPQYRFRVERPRDRLRLRRNLAGGRVSARRQSVWNRRHGRQHLGMVPRLLRTVSAWTESESAWTDHGRQARSPRRQLEIALQQFTDNGPGLERPQLFLQRSRISDRVRMRLGATVDFTD